MRVLWLAVLGVAAYAIFLVATLPASYLLAKAREAQPGKFDVLESQGTAWRGKARVTLHTPGGPIPVEEMTWDWLPSRLLVGRIAYQLDAKAPGMFATYQGARSLTRWEVHNLEARGSAAAMVTLLPWLAPWRPEGNVLVTSRRLESDGQELRGEARVEWSHAAVALSQVKPLGTFRADIKAEGNAGTVTVTTPQGPLRVTGSGKLTPPTRLDFTGEARAEGPQAAALQPLLELLGPARPDGARAIAWQAR